MTLLPAACRRTWQERSGRYGEGLGGSLVYRGHRLLAYRAPAVRAATVTANGTTASGRGRGGRTGDYSSRERT